MEQSNGLEGVIAVTTAIGSVDGERGELVVRGHRMEDVAPRWTYGDAIESLWGPEVPETHVERLGQRRAEAFRQLYDGGALRRSTGPMDFLRLALSAIDPTEDLAEDALAATAMLGVAAPAWWRLAHGDAPIPPNESLDTATDYLRMLSGEAPSVERARALETYLVTVVDHGMNASTFTARVIASTHSDLISAVAGAVGALKGPLHGGAPGPVLDMLDEIGRPEAAEAWIRDRIASGHRIMGMGHRVYRVRDPRAQIFERALRELQKDETSERLALAHAVESAAERVLAELKPDRALKANVEFYTSVLLEAVGVPRQLFTPTFAVGRVLGWCAHIMEQRRTGRLIRPRSAYSGSRPT